MSAPVGCGLGGTEFKVARSSLAWEELPVVITAYSVGLGRGCFYLIFAMGNLKIKDLRKIILFAPKFWLAAMNVPAKSI